MQQHLISVPETPVQEDNHSRGVESSCCTTVVGANAVGSRHRNLSSLLF